MVRVRKERKFVRHIDVIKNMYNGLITGMRIVGGNTSKFLIMISFTPRIYPKSSSFCLSYE